VFDEVFADRYAYDPLDAPQLLRHFLAAKRVTVHESCRAILLCVWWEPTDPAGHPAFAAHADAAARLAAALPDADVTVLCASHQQLWSHWHDVGDAVLREHVAHLRARYSRTPSATAASTPSSSAPPGGGHRDERAASRGA
jgi:hypothetical protein